MHACKICKSTIKNDIDFGTMPIANGFLLPNQYEKEYFYNLAVGFCSNCKMVQLIDQPDREMMFHENYAFFSSTSTRMQEHFRTFAEYVKLNFLSRGDPFVVEMGSNDGIMLKNFAQAHIRHLGIEPSANVAEVARRSGVNTISKFFDKNLAADVVSQYGQADAILAANCMCHIPNLHSIAEGIRVLLKPQGALIFEDPYLGDIVKKTSYDQVYDEHAYYFSLGAVSNLFKKHGMEVFDVQPQSVHGGSMRYYIGHKGARHPSHAVFLQCQQEESIGLYELDTYVHLKKNIERSRDDLMAILRGLINKGKRIVGYAATSKSTTVTNYCGITPSIVEYICDTTPIKHGKFSPGVHIPVRPYEEFKNAYPDYALLFGWNHSREIMEKEQDFRKAGGKWIVYVPEVRVI